MKWFLFDIFDRMNASMVDELLDALKSDMISQDANITRSIKILREVEKPDVAEHWTTLIASSRT